jgi:hypothetical protein
MTNINGQQPVVLLISKEEREECFFKQWLEENEPHVCEADDFFQIIEEINDFTQRRRPDVFLLEVESASRDSLREMLYFSSDENEIQIIAYSETIGGNNRDTAALSLGA